MKNSVKRQKQDRRGEAILDHAQCQCGCRQWDLLDVRHGQIYIKGHGGLALLERRKERLVSVLTLALFGRGAAWEWAAAAARALVEKALKLAQKLVEREWNYREMRWI